MKKPIISTKKKFRDTCVVLIIILSSTLSTHAQENITTNDLRGYISIIKDKSNEANVYAENASYALTFKDAERNAKLAISLINEAQKTLDDATKALEKIIKPTDNVKYERTMLNINNGIVDLQNKTNYTTQQLTKLFTAEDSEDSKSFATNAMNEIKRMGKTITEIEEEILTAEKSLSSVD